MNPATFDCCSVDDEMTDEDLDGAVHHRYTAECSDREKEDPVQQQRNGVLATAMCVLPRKQRISSPRVCSILPSLVPPWSCHPTVSAHQHYPAPNSGPLLMGIATHIQPNSTAYPPEHMQLPGPSFGPGPMYGYGGLMGYGTEYESTVFPNENGMLLSDNGMVLPPPPPPPPPPPGGYYPPQSCYGQQCYPDVYYGNMAGDQSQDTDPVVVS